MPTDPPGADSAAGGEPPRSPEANPPQADQRRAPQARQTPPPLDLQTAFSVAFRRLDDYRLEISMNGRGAWVLMRQLQLAHRCPGNLGDGSRLAAALGRLIQTQIAPSGALAAVAEEGWAPAEGPPEADWIDAWPSASPW